jgi:hypothetical protein
MIVVRAIDGRDDFEPPDKWFWCLHCQRCYQAWELQWCDECGFVHCPYADCDGAAFIDGWDWQRDFFPRGFPETPTRGKIYDQYEPNAE